MADVPDLLGVLWALMALTSGDVNDSVPKYQVRLETGGSTVEFEEVLATLTEMGLAQTVSIWDGIAWIGITTRGVHVMSGLTSGAVH